MRDILISDSAVSDDWALFLFLFACMQLHYYPAGRNLISMQRA